MPPKVPLSENVLAREEAMKLWAELDAMGTMIIEGFYGYTMGAEAPQFVGGCHCCGCCCAILNSARLGTLKETVQRSNYRVVKDYDKCHGCGECVRRCQVFAHTFDKVTDRKPVYHRDRCVGCGSCGRDVPRVRFIWSRFRKRSGSMLLPVSPNGKNSACGIWPRSSNTAAQIPRSELTPSQKQSNKL